MANPSTMKRRLLCGLGGIVGIIVLALAANDLWNHETRLSEASATRFGQCDASISDLPDHISAPSGDWLLFADVAHVVDHFMPVYLINRAGKSETLPFPTREDLSIELEWADDSGDWARAFPHYFPVGECGMSYLARQLPIPVAESFRRFELGIPSYCKPARLRFAVHSRSGRTPIVSNEFDGYVYPRCATPVKTDHLALRQGDFNFVCRVARGEFQTPELAMRNVENVFLDPRIAAIAELCHSRFANEDVEAALETILAERGAIYADEARDALSRLRSRARRTAP